MDVECERSDLSFDTAKSIRYHSYRRSYFKNFENLTKILTAVSGTAAFVSILGEMRIISLFFSLLIAIAATSDLVIDFSERATLYDRLYKEFCDLGISIETNENPTTHDIVDWKRKRLELEREEPTPIDLLERRCSAEECRARGWDVPPEWDLSRCQIFYSRIALFAPPWRSR